MLKNAIKVVGGIASDLRRRGAYKVLPFSHWGPELDAALRTLPEMYGCPHDLFRILATNPGSAAKQIRLVLEKDTPLAIVALRQRHSDWVPVTHYCVPGALFPAQPGRVGDAADVLGVDLFLAWWRQPTDPPEIANARVVRSIPTFKMTCGTDIEGFWRARGHFNNVTRMRKRCEQFRVVLDFPGAMEWVTRKWEEKWRSPSIVPAADLDDRLLSARYLEKRGAHHTVIVLDGDRPIAGNTYIVHGHELAWMYTYREPEYDRFGLGYRLLDFSFEWRLERVIAKSIWAAATSPSNPNGDRKTGRSGRSAFVRSWTIARSSCGAPSARSNQLPSKGCDPTSLARTAVEARSSALS